MDQTAVMNSCDMKAERIGLERLTDVEQIVVLVSRINFEVELGGLSSFFYNSAGNYSGETVTALQAVGATQAAATLRAASSLFPGVVVPPDRKERYAAWEEIKEALSSLNGDFSRDDPDVFARLCQYIDEHARELQEHS